MGANIIDRTASHQGFFVQVIFPIWNFFNVFMDVEENVIPFLCQILF